jgi:hypothetical protein
MISGGSAPARPGEERLGEYGGDTLSIHDFYYLYTLVPAVVTTACQRRQQKVKPWASGGIRQEER